MLNDVLPNHAPPDVVNGANANTIGASQYRRSHRRQRPYMAHSLVCQLGLAVGLAIANTSAQNTERMPQVVGDGHVFEVLNPVVVLDPVLVVNGHAVRHGPNERGQHKAMDRIESAFAPRRGQLYPNVAFVYRAAHEVAVGSAPYVRIETPHSANIAHFIPTLKAADVAPLFLLLGHETSVPEHGENA